MSNISVLRQCVRFWGQTFKNVHDIRKMCLRKYLCVLMSLSESYVFVLLETCVGCSYDLEEYVYELKVLVRPHLVYTRGPSEGPKRRTQTALSVSTNEGKRRPVVQPTIHLLPSYIGPSRFVIQYQNIHKCKPVRPHQHSVGLVSFVKPAKAIKELPWLGVFY